MEIRKLSEVEPEERGGAVQESTALKKDGIVGHVGEQVVTVNEVTFRPGERTKMHKHTYGQVLYVTRGSGVVATADEEHPVDEGDLIFIQPGKAHWHGTAHEDPVKFTHITYVIRDEPGKDTTPVGDIEE